MRAPSPPSRRKHLVGGRLKSLVAGRLRSQRPVVGPLRSQLLAEGRPRSQRCRLLRAGRLLQALRPRGAAWKASPRAFGTLMTLFISLRPTTTWISSSCGLPSSRNGTSARSKSCKRLGHSPILTVNRDEISVESAFHLTLKDEERWLTTGLAPPDIKHIDIRCYSKTHGSRSELSKRWT